MAEDTILNQTHKPKTSEPVTESKPVASPQPPKNEFSSASYAMAHSVKSSRPSGVGFSKEY